MNTVTVKFYNGNILVRTEIFSSVLEADLYLANESLTYDYYIIDIGESNAV